MTIIVSIAVPEGIVFSADSRQTYTNSRNDVRVSSDNAYKLFQLSESAAAATFGWAFLLGRNIHSHVNDFNISVGGQSLTVEDLAAKLGAHLNGVYQTHVEKKYDEPVAEGRFALGLLVGGFDRGARRGAVYEIRVPDGSIRRLMTTDEEPGSVWRGNTIALSRLIGGFDPGLPELKGWQAEWTGQIKLGDLSYRISYSRMPLQDAIDLAHLMVDTTIQMQRFTDGTYQFEGESANCGGAVDVAVVEQELGFQWVQRKQLTGRMRPHSASPGET